LHMLDDFRATLAHFMVEHFARRRSVVVGAWHWLAAEADEVEEKKRCVWAILDLDPDNTRALLGVLAFVLEGTHD